jgi:hypothetical protein
MHQFAPWSSDRAGPETRDVRRFGVMKDEIRRSATKLISASIKAWAFVWAKPKYRFRFGHPLGHFYSPIPSASDIARLDRSR